MQSAATVDARARASGARAHARAFDSLAFDSYICFLFPLISVSVFLVTFIAFLAFAFRYVTIDNRFCFRNSCFCFLFSLVAVAFCFALLVSPPLTLAFDCCIFACDHCFLMLLFVLLFFELRSHK